MPILKIVLCATGVFGSLLVYGILQEKIMTRAHGADIDAQRSSLSVLLVLSNRVLSTLVAAVVLVLKRKAVAPTAPVLAYAGISASNVFATTCQYEALLYVSFPVQTLCKCAKMIPVMIWSTTLYGKAYQVSDYLVAVGVMAGCALFATFDTGVVAIPKQTLSDMYGMILMTGYLCFDGLNTTLQEKLCSGYRIETFNQIFWVNLCSVIMSSCWLFLNLSVGKAITFGNHRISHCDVLILSAASTCGQLSILYTIREFGAVVLATIMTTRQFFSILLSCIIFMHPLSKLQWIGTVIVFISLYFKIRQKKTSDGQIDTYLEADSKK